MKLWAKISLLVIILIIAATNICSLLMLVSTGKSSLQAEIQSVLAIQRLRADSFVSAMQQELASGAQYDAIAKRALARYFMQQMADTGTTIVLICGDDDIYNPTYIDPRQYLPAPEADMQAAPRSQHYAYADIEENTILFAASSVKVDDIAYTVYAYYDITKVFTQVEELAIRFTIINLCIITAAGVLAVFIVRGMLNPVAELKKNTGLIAEGVYNKRIPIYKDDEIGELAADFNKMAEAVECRIGELKDEAERRMLFMGAVTHELKTPITSISGNAQTLLLTRLNDEEREEALVHIEKECARLERLSGKLMQLIVLKKNENLPLTLTPVSELFILVQNTVTESLKKKNIKLIVQNSLAELPMDKDLLCSLLLNLVDNAAKASLPGDTIKLCAEDNKIMVIDEGRGIPSAELAYITEPFYMVDKSRSHAAGGAGLGLALASEIARLHNAALNIKSNPSKGTTVEVVFKHEE